MKYAEKIFLTVVLGKVVKVQEKVAFLTAEIGITRKIKQTYPLEESKSSAALVFSRKIVAFL